MLAVVGILTSILGDDRDVIRTRLGVAGVLSGCGLIVLDAIFSGSSSFEFGGFGLVVWLVSLLLLIPRWKRLAVLGTVTGAVWLVASTMGTSFSDGSDPMFSTPQSAPS